MAREPIVEAKRSEEERQQRRDRREERRATQRLENVVRAKKMHAARVSREYETISGNGGPTAGPIHVGCSGWYYWHWKGQFYPQELPSSRWFGHYASKFKTVELNAPFYSWPTVSTVKNWLRQAGRRQFTYTVKVSELITHTKRFTGTKTLIRDFGLIADILGPRMGCFLFQLPPSFHYTPAALKRIVSQLDPGRKNVVEFRHRSWWNERVFKAFLDAGIIFCSCSGPRLPDELVKTADDIYVRFHGTKQWYRHDYSKEELATWAYRIVDSGAKNVWAYFNNDRDCYAIKNARQLTRAIKQVEHL
jgi:uncharacterized protein YecE (DUF72 family)